MAREVVVLSGVRTAIGDYGGGVKDKAPSALGAAVSLCLQSCTDNPLRKNRDLQR